MVLSTVFGGGFFLGGVVFVFVFVFFSFFFSSLFSRVFALHGTVKLRYFECSVFRPVGTVHRSSVPGHADSGCLCSMFLEEIFLMSSELLLSFVDCIKHVSV